MPRLNCKIIAKRGDKIEVEIEGQKLAVSSKFFPDEVLEKEQFQVFFLNPKYQSVQDKNLAKAILEEILNGR